jgi:hypothetical protein
MTGHPEESKDAGVIFGAGLTWDGKVDRPLRRAMLIFGAVGALFANALGDRVPPMLCAIRHVIGRQPVYKMNASWSPRQIPKRARLDGVPSSRDYGEDAASLFVSGSFACASRKGPD